MCRLAGNRRGEDNAVNAEFQYKYDNEEVKSKPRSSSRDVFEQGAPL